jgi:hypothetical protein
VESWILGDLYSTIVKFYAITLEKSLPFSQNVKNRDAKQLRNYIFMSYTREMETSVHAKTCTQMFITLFIKAKKQK